MKNKILISLRTEVLSAIALIIIITSVLLASFFVKTYKETLENNLKNKAEIFAKDLAVSCEHYLSVNQQKTLNYIAEKAMTEEDVVSLQVYNKDFVEVVATQVASPDINKFIADKKAKVDKINETRAIVHEFKGNTRFFEVLTPIFTFKKIEDITGIDKINSNQLKELMGAVRIIVSFASTDKEISRVSNIVVIISIGVIILGLGLSLLIVRIILNPIERLYVGVNKISSGDLSFRVPDVKIKEIEYLIEKFNSMQDILDKTLKDLSDEKDKLFNNKLHLEEVINKMKIMQEDLLEAERFSTIGKLAAVLAHELKNPLTSLQNIMFYFSQIKDFSDEGSAKMLKMFFEESSRSGKILSDLLDFSRLDSLHKIAVYVDDIAHHVVVTSCLSKNVQIKENFEHIKAYIDASKLSQALGQLLINAKDSMKDGGTIYMSVKNSTGFVEIKVRDTGAGIKRDVIKNIWDPLFTTKLKSVGIGLAVVKKIVDLHSGSITITSEENRGTEFTINLPLMEE